MGSAGGFAVNGDDVRIVVAQATDPCSEALGEQGMVECIHQVVQRIMAGDAVLVGQEAAQEVHVGFAPVFDRDEVVGRGDGGAAKW